MTPERLAAVRRAWSGVREAWIGYGRPPRINAMDPEQFIALRKVMEKGGDKEATGLEPFRPINFDISYSFSTDRFDVHVGGTWITWEPPV